MTPAPKGSRHGNRVTAQRWARILRGLGHSVIIEQAYSGRACDLMVALHARKSFPSIEQFKTQRPGSSLVVAMTGTDVYQDLQTSAEARRSLEFADRIIALQPLAAQELPPRQREKTVVIYQSVPPPKRREVPKGDVFEVCVLSHLRAVKDPFRAAEAARLLPKDSRIRILHLGAALEPGMAERARAEAATNPRYRWLGDRPRWQALRILGRSRLLIISSVLEGGANVISEALAARVPVISSRIPGSIGLLGADYPGYFEVGDTSGLASLLQRAGADDEFYSDLKCRCERLRPLVDPARERASWESLLCEIRQPLG